MKTEIFGKKQANYVLNQFAISISTEQANLPKKQVTGVPVCSKAAYGSDI